MILTTELSFPQTLTRLLVRSFVHSKDLSPGTHWSSYCFLEVRYDLRLSCKTESFWEISVQKYKWKFFGHTPYSIKEFVGSLFYCLLQLYFPLYTDLLCKKRDLWYFLTNITKFAYRNVMNIWHILKSTEVIMQICA